MASVFMTGGAGFLGRALLKNYPGYQWTVYSRDEHKLRKVESRYDARTVAGDIGDYERLKLAMTGHQYVVHAAASKYVDRGETHPEEVAHANVLGTMNVLRAAEAVGVERVVTISTDKAVEPVNAYGLSKALTEYLSLRAQVPTVVARYGNVIGSTGSVIERWLASREQTIEVTNPSMTRFWMTVDEAARLVDDALIKADPWTILIPELRSASILELAVACVGGRMEVVGERLGEKQHETLLSEREADRSEWSGEGYITLTPPYSLALPRWRKSGPSFYETIISVPAQHSDTAARWSDWALKAAIREPLP
jgi:UDP-N-acetylglucosamine 4,6-dehydratase